MSDIYVAEILRGGGARGGRFRKNPPNVPAGIHISARPCVYAAAAAAAVAR